MKGNQVMEDLIIEMTKMLIYMLVQVYLFALENGLDKKKKKCTRRLFRGEQGTPQEFCLGKVVYSSYCTS